MTELTRREANWSRRTDIVNYCVGVLDESVEAKRQSILDAGDDASAQRKARGALYAEEVKVSPPGTPPLTSLAELKPVCAAKSSSKRADCRGHCAKAGARRYVMPLRP